MALAVLAARWLACELGDQIYTGQTRRFESNGAWQGHGQHPTSKWKLVSAASPRSGMLGALKPHSPNSAARVNKSSNNWIRVVPVFICFIHGVSGLPASHSLDPESLGFAAGVIRIGLCQAEVYGYAENLCIGNCSLHLGMMLQVTMPSKAAIKMYKDITRYVSSGGLSSQPELLINSTFSLLAPSTGLIQERKDCIIATFIVNVFLKESIQSLLIANQCLQQAIKAQTP